MSYLNELFDLAKSRRTNVKTAWKDIALSFRPNRGEMCGEKTEGTMRDPRLIHPAPMTAVNKLSSRLTSDLTDVAVNGFQLVAADKGLGDINQEVEWAQNVSRVMRSVLQLPATNFQSANATFTGDLVAFGTAVMHVKEQDTFPFVSLRTVHLEDVYILDNYKGMIDVVFEEIEMNGRQLLQEFGDKLPADMLKAIEKDPFEKREIYKVTADKETLSKMGVKVAQPYGIVYATEEMEIFDESSISYFPYIVARFELKTGEIYGRSPAWDGLPYARRLTMLQLMHARALQRLYDPAILTTDDSILPKGRLIPGQRIDGGIDAITGQRALDYLTFPVDLNVGLAEEQYIVQQIQELFFVQGLPDNKNVRMTQVEVQARLAELKAMSPNVGRIINEYLNPLMITLYSVLQRKKVLPAKPSEIKDVPYKFNFMGSLTNIYKFSEAESIQQLYQLLAVVGQFDPKVLGIMKHEKALYALADIFNAPLSIIKTEEELNAERQAAAEQQAALQQAQIAQQYSEVAKNTTQANAPFGGQ